ncbi:type II secretion system F family protein [Thauera sp. ZXT1-4]|uniref:type II secretion system F family protein n=1 Tax=Thauera sp. ZXT1-4 TaxID=3460294 RepID=UPI0040407155
MPEFAYRAVDARGHFTDGLIEAADLQAAVGQLRARGLTPVSVDGAGATAHVHHRPDQGKRSRRLAFGRDAGIKAEDIHNITTELAVMLRAGLPLDRALRVLLGMADKPAQADLLHDILESVKAGKGFSQALQAHHQHFGDFYISMVRSGEAGGQLGDVLTRLSEHLERVKSLRESVVSALIYPAILIVVACISVVLMLGFVVPQFETLFEDMGEALPMPTRVIVALGDFVAGRWWLLLGLAVLAIWGARRWLRTPQGAVWRDTLLLRLPLLGPIMRKYELTRFARSMGTLLGNGVPMVMSLRIAADTVGNSILREAIDRVPADIKQGKRLADALAATGLMTPLALNMVRLGEETGRLDAMLLELARVYDGDVQAGVKRGLTMLEPLLILVLGGVIAAIIVSILLGILSVNDLAG